VENNTVPKGVVFKWIIAKRPWLYIIAQNIYSYPGLTLEELREVSRLKASVIKRGVWWLKKYGVAEDRGGKLFIAKNYVKTLESLVLSTCSTGDVYLVLIDQVYIVLRIIGGKIEHWSLPANLYDKIYRQRDLVEQCNPERVSSSLGVNLGTAKRLCTLVGLLRECRGVK
jgi:hypothetical protein